ncbi:hypothetical protein LENED_005694 [Lentinula edodes]|uniref:Uncharacterized protein n=1 Tax=Lentinula edodes TaxID=5353 RepID=A0A1Q3E9X6_LENED|nr:hypothetical protein LENED_005694 [Lentinula edodes]
MFAPHYTKKRNAAVGTARAITGCDLLVGNRRMPPSITKQLYTALVDCHLTNGCEVIPDTDPSLIQILEDVQIRFLCRMLNLSNNSVITPLFTESGIMPIRTRRASLALRYLKYLITLPPSHYAFSALWDNDNLRRAGSRTWTMPSPNSRATTACLTFRISTMTVLTLSSKPLSSPQNLNYNPISTPGQNSLYSEIA